MGSSRSNIRKAIVGYEGSYEVDDSGNLFSLPRYNGRYWLKGKVLSPETTKHGYKRATLSLDGVIRKMSVHRIVASAFIPNPENLPVVNHKDGNKLNNRVDNLEWCTVGFNNQHARDSGLVPPTCNKIEEDIRDRILAYYVKGCSDRGVIGTAKKFGVSKSSVSNFVREDSQCFKN